jgi:hypothetical protein
MPFVANFSGYHKKLVAVGLATFMWAIWKTRNKACFQEIF